MCAGVTIETDMTLPEGGSGLCPVVLTSEPTAPVTFAVAVPTGADIEIIPSVLTFTSANWNKTQTLTVRALQDADAVADEPVRLVHAVRGGDYDGLSVPTVTVTITEDDTPGVTVSETKVTVGEGDSGTYTVVLDTQPAADVTVAVAVPTEADLTVTPPTVTFTQANWNTPQTLTVTALQDADAAADEPATLTHAIHGGDYDGLVAAAVTVAIIEDDAPGVTLSETALTLIEGDEGSYAVVLDTQPTEPVTVAVTVPTGADLTATPPTVMFSTANWNTPQTLTISALQDADAVADEPMRLTHAIRGGDYDGLAAAAVTVAIIEDDAPGVTLSKTALPLTEGDSGSYAVVLDTQPTAPVTVAVTVPTSADLTATPLTVTFSTANWNTPQTLTVRALQDADAAADEPVRLVHATRGGDYDGLSVPTVTVTITEDDAPGATLSETALTLAEGDSDSYAVVLDTQPTEPVTFEVAVPTGVDIAVVPPMVTFTAANWNAPQTLTVTALQDADAVADEPVRLAHGVRGGDYEGLSVPIVTVTITEDDVPGVTLSETELTVGEGDSGTYAVVLDTQPTEPVTVAVGVPTRADLTATPPTLTFSQANWNAPQTLTISAAQDADAVADEPATLTHAIRGGDYDGLSVPTVKVMITEDDVTGVTVSATKMTVPEGGEDQYTVVLDTQPTADVTVAVEVPADTDLTATPLTVTFTQANWNAPQTLTISALQDADAVADEPATLTHAIRGGDYDGLAAAGVEVTITEDDVPGVTLSETALTLTEGDSGTYAVVLDTQPTEPVTVAVEVPTGADLTATPPTLTFSQANWNTPQTVTVTALQDADAAADEPATLTHAISGGDYEGLSVPTVAVTITEDDTPTLSIADADAPESAGTILFTVALSMVSSQTVTVDCRTADGTARADQDYMEAAPLLTFAPGQTEAKIAVPIINDALDEGAETFAIVLSNPTYAMLATGTATGTITDDDPSVARAWLARFGRTVASRAVDAIDERLTQPAGADAHLTVGGQRLTLSPPSPDAPVRGNYNHLYHYDPLARSTPLGSAARPGQGSTAGLGYQTGATRHSFFNTLANRSLSDILAQSSFLVSFNSAEANGQSKGPRWTLWSRWEATRFRGEEVHLSLNGDVLTGLFGLDREQGRLLAGLAVSHNLGEGEFHVRTAEDPYARGPAKSGLTSLYPYLRVAVDERLSAWGLFGHGRGWLAPLAGRSRSAIAMNMGGLGLRGTLLSPTGPSGLDLSLRSDAFLMKMHADAAAPEASQLRLALEGTHSVLLDSSRTWTPSLEVGVRHDRGDAETGLGLEVGGGLGYTDPGPGLTIEATGRRLLVHQDRGYDEWGVGGSLRLNPGALGRGLGLRLRSSYGAAASGVDRFWSPHRTSYAGNSSAGRSGLFNAELGYGMRALGGLVTPYADVGLSGRSARTYGLGWRLRVDPSLRLALTGNRRTSAATLPTHELRLRGTLHW